MHSSSLSLSLYLLYLQWALLCPKPITNHRWSNTNGPHKTASHQLPGPSLFYHHLPAVKLRDTLYGYQLNVAVCSKKEVEGLFYELSIFNLKPLVTPLRDTVEMLLRQVFGLMATNSWYPSIAEACSNIMVVTATSCPRQKCPSISCPTADCPRQTALRRLPTSRRENHFCPLLVALHPFWHHSGRPILCALPLVGVWCRCQYSDYRPASLFGWEHYQQLEYHEFLLGLSYPKELR